MKTTTKRITLVAALTAGIGAAYAVAPSYAQEAAAPAEADTAVAQFMPGQHRGGPGGPGHAGMPGHPGMNARAGELMETFDTDGDGTVTQEEIDGVRAAELAEFDADGDGMLSLEEYQELWLANVYERMVDAFQNLDADGDGEVTEEEFNAAFANIVARMDFNGDGGLNADDRPERPERPQTERIQAERQGQAGPGGRVIIMTPGIGR